MSASFLHHCWTPTCFICNYRNTAVSERVLYSVIFAQQWTYQSMTFSTGVINVGWTIVIYLEYYPMQDFIARSQSSCTAPLRCVPVWSGLRFEDATIMRPSILAHGLNGWFGHRIFWKLYPKDDAHCRKLNLETRPIIMQFCIVIYVLHCVPIKCSDPGYQYFIVHSGV